MYNSELQNIKYAVNMLKDVALENATNEYQTRDIKMWSNDVDISFKAICYNNQSREADIAQATANLINGVHLLGNRDVNDYKATDYIENNIDNLILSLQTTELPEPEEYDPNDYPNY